MLFTELRFLPFFMLVFVVHWTLKSNTLRKVWLLVASYAFYAAWDWRFLGLILVSTLVDYVAGLRIAHSTRRRPWLFLSLAVNLSLLGFFKYFHFFVGSAVDLLGVMGFEAHRPTLEIILPVGISFYTFQTLSYSLDIYFRKLSPTKSLLDLATFVAFFPQLVAGPIVRARHFLPLLECKRVLARVDVRGALMLFLVGFIKKACVSDNIASTIESYYSDPSSFDAFSAWMATFYYAVQVYCDFSGYSDMAIACAALLGYRLPLNFNFPYTARNITDLLRSWHISFSTWLRDYIYIPLGGNRNSNLLTIRNLMITMLLGGLWHGADWHFVVWGGLLGVGLVVHRAWLDHAPERLRRPIAFVGLPLTFVYWNICLLFFRAQSLPDALVGLRAFVFLQAEGTKHLETWHLAIFGIFALMHIASYRQWFHLWWRRVPSWGFGAAYGALLALVVPFQSFDFTPFIYFQF